MPLLAIAALIVIRSLFQYWQNAVSHHTANMVKIGLRHDVYDQLLKLGPGYSDRNRTGDVVLTLVEGIERLETFFGQYLSQMIVSSIAPIAIFAYMVTLDIYIALIFLVFALATLAVPSVFPPVEPREQLSTSAIVRRVGFGFLGQRAGFGDAEIIRTEQATRQRVGRNVSTTSIAARWAWWLRIRRRAEHRYCS